MVCGNPLQMGYKGVNGRLFRVKKYRNLPWVSCDTGCGNLPLELLAGFEPATSSLPRTRSYLLSYSSMSSFRRFHIISQENRDCNPFFLGFSKK